MKDDTVYITDTGNSRILCFDKNSLKLTRVFGKPKIDMLGSDYTYSPTGIVVDLANCMYVISSGINQGLLQLDENGNFMGFIGAPKVVPNYLDLLWQNFSTQAQKDRVTKLTPTEYTSVDIDGKGFMYVTSRSTDIPPVARLNSQGENILKINVNYPNGDGWYTDSTGKATKSSFIDIAVREDGTYFCLDSMRGRIFVYNKEGTMLYAFGALGSQNGTFYSPSAIALINDEVVVVDKVKGNINVFKKTDFANKIDVAVTHQDDGDYSKVQGDWNEVLKQCPNYYLANIGIARIEIQNKDYQAALTKLEPVKEMKYYSEAYRGFRSLFVRDNFKIIFFGVILLILIFTFLPKRLNRLTFVNKIRNMRLVKELKFSTYCMFHPFNGFWEVKREKQGSIQTASVLFGLFILFYALRAQYSGFLFTGKEPDEVNVLLELVKIVIPLLLWCVSNWCFTTLMDGEGNLKDIFIATSYALKPYIILSIPLFLLSHILVTEEMFIYTTLNTIAIGWVLILLLFGMMVTHDYSLKKTVITLILTLIGICLIIFIILVFTNILQDVYSFCMDSYKEITFRLY